MTQATVTFGKKFADGVLANFSKVKSNDKEFAKVPVGEGETFILARGVKVAALHCVGEIATGGNVLGDGMAQIGAGSAKIQVTVPGTTAKRVIPASTLEPDKREIAAINLFKSAPLAGLEEAVEHMSRYLDSAEAEDVG